ncbi:MAG: PadR family transcriptional regulator [Candidatus Dormibacteria bacterium]
MDRQGRLNATSGALLGLLRRHGEMTGGELMRTAKLVIGGYWTLSRSQVYRELAALAAHGLVWNGPPGPRDARSHRLTEAGESAFLAWFQDGPGEDTIRIPILLTVGFGAALPAGRLAAILDDYERRHEELLAHYRALYAELDHAGEDPHIRATLSFGLLPGVAVLAWLAQLPAELRGRRWPGKGRQLRTGVSEVAGPAHPDKRRARDTARKVT